MKSATSCTIPALAKQRKIFGNPVAIGKGNWVVFVSLIGLFEEPRQTETIWPKKGTVPLL